MIRKQLPQGFRDEFGALAQKKEQRQKDDRPDRIRRFGVFQKLDDLVDHEPKNTDLDDRFQISRDNAAYVRCYVEMHE